MEKSNAFSDNENLPAGKQNEYSMTCCTCYENNAYNRKFRQYF